MNLYQRNNGRRIGWGPPRGRRLFVATIIVLVLFIMDALSGGKIRSVARQVGSEVWKLGSTVAESFVGSGFIGSRRALTKENSALTQQIAQMQERVAACRVLEDENKALRDVLRVAGVERGPARESGITAPIVSSFRSSPYGTFQVGAGSADSVSPGNIVLSAENFVIGRVEEVDLHTALVREIFAPNVSSDALLRGVGVTVEGRGGGNARTSVPRQTDVAVGDTIISPVLRARAIGIIGKVSEDSGSAYKRINIYLPVNLLSLQFVYIVKN